MIDRLEVRHGKGRGIVLLGYSYRTREGEETTHHTVLRENIPYEIKEIRLGDTVLVVYDRDDPSRNEIDRFEVRREDRCRLTAEGER